MDEIVAVNKALEQALAKTKLGPGTRLLYVGCGNGIFRNVVNAWLNYRHRWHFFLVEPRPDLYLELAEDYGNKSHVTVHQACIVRPDIPDGELTMWEYDNLHALPVWAPFAGSTNREYLTTLNKRYNIKGICTAVSCWGQTLQSVMDEILCTAPDVIIATMAGDERLVVATPLLKTASIVCYSYKSQSDESLTHVRTMLGDHDFSLIMQDGYDVWVRTSNRNSDVSKEPCGKTTLGEPCKNRDKYCGLRRGCTF